MKLFTTFFNRFISTKPLMYGRWHLDYDYSIQDRKVYLTNMDHCGCCETIIEPKKIINNKKNKYKELNDEYLLPYFL
jgi:hypothetical protein